MYISSFHIDGFGILSNITVKDLGPGLSVFLGRNEAGKSTCLEFLRTMLAGYPEKSKDFYEKWEPVSGAQAGGTLLLNCELADGAWQKTRLTRRPARNGGLYLEDDSGNPLLEERLKAIFAGVSQEVYRKVFGFSLGELESFESLSGEDARNVLYGASFGPGLVSPALALKNLQARKDALFKEGGRAPLNAALKELEELRKAIREKEDISASYDQLCLSRDRRKEELAALAAERAALETRLRSLQRRLAVWEQRDQWREIKDRLDHLPDLPENFPQDALERLAQLRAMRDERASDLAGQRKKLEALRERRDSLRVNEAILALVPSLRSLAESKESYRSAAADLDGIRESLARGREELEDLLARLGPGWDCARIKAADRSLFARDDLSRHEEAIHSARLAYQAAGNTLESANQEVEACERACAAANEALSQFSEPEAILDGKERDELRENMGRLNESRRLEKIREEAFKKAREDFERSLSQAKISIDAAEDQELAEAEKILKNIDSNQDEAFKLARELQVSQSELENINQKAARLEEEAETLNKKADEAAAQSRANPDLSRDSLEMKGRALRSLRALDGQITSAKERMQELDARINSVPKPARVINWTLLVAGVLLAITGAGFFAANYFWGLAAISISGGPSLTISSWICYLLIACGVLLATFGFPANNPEKRRYQQDIFQLQNARENMALRLVELDDQARQLFKAVGVNSVDPITLDAREMMLEREKEQCIHDERSRKDAENMRRDLSSLRAQATALRNEARAKEQEIQQCRRKWLALMDSLQIEGCPSPESVATVFMRVEAASVALGRTWAASRELEELWDQLYLLESAITSMPAIQRKLQSAAVPLSLEEAVSQTLEACREADIAREQRNMALAAVKTVENGLDSARRRQEEASLRLEKAAENLELRRKEWAAATAGFGLGENLDPKILREALQIMDQALLAEENTLRLEQELQKAENGKSAFEKAAGGFLASLGREAPSDGDWLSALDNLLAEADAAAELLNERNRLDSLIAEHEDEYGARDAAYETGKASLNALLIQGGSESEDAFAQTARLVEEKNRLEENLENLESSLRVAADKQDLESFLKAFEEDSRESQEQNLASIEDSLRMLSGREQEAAASLGSMEARIENMASMDELTGLRQEEAMLLASVEKMAKQWARLALAESILLEAKREFEKERQPEVIRIASEIFSAITNRRWKGLKTSLEDSRLEILPGHGEPVPPGKLSRGAQEQAYLALRLAYIRDHAARAIPLPVIMDEILVNFDPKRAASAAKVLADMAENPAYGKPQQILYFTCQPHIMEILQKAAPSSSLFVVENGDICPA